VASQNGRTDLMEKGSPTALPEQKWLSERAGGDAQKPRRINENERVRQGGFALAAKTGLLAARGNDSKANTQISVRRIGLRLLCPMALKGPHTTAQGAALGNSYYGGKALKERDASANRLCRPSRASESTAQFNPRLRPGLSHCALSGHPCESSLVRPVTRELVVFRLLKVFKASVLV